MKGVDVSYHNGWVDWPLLKQHGIDFAICRTGYGKTGYDDTFIQNVNGAHDVGMICGAYHYSYALTPNDAIIEADFCKRIIHEAGCLLELPVFFDLEDADNYKANHGFSFSRRLMTEICRAFIETIKPLNCGIYTSVTWLENYVDWKSLECPVWNAQWNIRDDFGGYMWQYTSDLWIGGKKFDGNILYDDKDRPQADRKNSTK